MKRAQMQTIVNCVNVQSDCLWEFINDKRTHPDDRILFLGELNDLCDFMLEARRMGFDVSKSSYPLDKKVAKLKGNA